MSNISQIINVYGNKLKPGMLDSANLFCENLCSKPDIEKELFVPKERCLRVCKVLGKNIIDAGIETSAQIAPKWESKYIRDVLYQSQQ